MKEIPNNKANMLFRTGCGCGTTITASGATDDPIRYTEFGSFTEGFKLFKYNKIMANRTKSTERQTQMMATF